MPSLVIWSIFWLTIFGISNVSAHIAGATYTSAWVAKAGVKLVYVVPADNLAELHKNQNNGITIEPSQAYLDDIINGYHVTNNNLPCAPELVSHEALTQVPSYQYVIIFNCEKIPEDIHIGYRLFIDLSESHENFIDVHVASEKLDLVLSQHQPIVHIPVNTLLQGSDQLLAKNFPIDDYIDPGVSRFLGLGIEHILIGIDHVLFVISLLLITMPLRRLALLVTSFTIGHSITLILASFDYLSINLRFAESIIALSIAYVAIDNIIRLSSQQGRAPIIKKNKPSGRWAIVFVFGLIHGFGFSSVLRDLGLPEDGLVVSLLLFNIGIEIGQLMIIVVTLPLVWLIWKKISYRGFSILASSVIGLLGLYWFVERALVQ